MIKVIATAVLLSLGMAGCASDKAYVNSDQQTFEAVAPVYLDYSEKDEALTEADKQARRDVVRSWEKRLQEAKDGDKLPEETK